MLFGPRVPVLTCSPGRQGGRTWHTHAHPGGAAMPAVLLLEHAWEPWRGFPRDMYRGVQYAGAHHPARRDAKHSVANARGNIHKHSQTCIEKTCRDVLLAVYVSCVHLCASRSWLRAHSTAAGPEMTTATIVLLASTACTAGVFLSGLPAEEDRLCRRSKEA